MNRIGFALSILFLAGFSLSGIFWRQSASGTVMPQIIDQFGGAVYDVAVEQSLAYVGVGPRLVVVDVSRPEAPAMVGQSDILPGVVRRVVLDFPYAYVATGVGGLQIVDVREPTQSRVVGVYQTDGYVEDVAVAGDYAYIASSPVWDGGQWTGDGLQVVDISKPLSPLPIASYDTPGWSFGVDVSGNRVFVADGDGGIRVLDVSQPTAPKELGFFQTTGPAMDVVVADDYAYVADFVQGLSIVDVTDARTPRQVGVAQTGGQARRVFYDQRHAYVAAGEKGLSIVDASQPDKPQAIGAWNQGDIRGMMVQGDYLYMADRKNGFRIVDAGKGDDLAPMGSWDALGPVEGIAALHDEQGDALVFVTTGDNVRTFRIPNEGAPDMVGSYDTPGRGVDVAVNVSLAGPGQSYLVAVAESPTWLGDVWSETGVRLYETDAGQQLQEMTFLHLSGQVQKVDFVGDVLFVAAGSGGLQAVDVSSPRAPRTVGRYVPDPAVVGVTVAGNECAYLNTAGQVIDVCLGEAPTYETGDQALPAPTPNPRAKSVQAEGLRPLTRKRIGVEALHYHEGFLLFSDPAVSGVLLSGERNESGRLRQLESQQTSRSESIEVLDTAGHIMDIAILGTDMYLADGDGGVVIVSFEDESGDK